MENYTMQQKPLRTERGLWYLFLGNLLMVTIASLNLVLFYLLDIVDMDLCFCCNLPILVGPYLLGFVMLYAGRREFSHEHERMFRYLLVCPLIFVCGLVFLILVDQIYVLDGSDIYVRVGGILVVLAVPMAAWEVSRILVIYHLLKRKEKNILFLATALATITYVLFVASELEFIVALDVFNKNNFTIIMTPLIVSFLVYMHVNYNALFRVRSGELQPREGAVRYRVRTGQKDMMITNPKMPVIPLNKEAAYDMMRSDMNVEMQLPPEPEIEEIPEEEKVDFYRSTDEIEIRKGDGRDIPGP